MSVWVVILVVGRGFQAIPTILAIKQDETSAYAVVGRIAASDDPPKDTAYHVFEATVDVV